MTDNVTGNNDSTAFERNAPKLTGDLETDLKLLMGMSSDEQRAITDNAEKVLKEHGERYSANKEKALVDVSKNILTNIGTLIDDFAAALSILSSDFMKARYEPAVGVEEYANLRSRVAVMGYTLTSIGAEYHHMTFGPDKSGDVIDVD